MLRRRAATRLALAAAATTAVLVFVLVQLLHPLHAWLAAAAAQAAVRANAVVDDTQWATCHVRADPFVEWRPQRRPAIVILANCELKAPEVRIHCLDAVNAGTVLANWSAAPGTGGRFAMSHYGLSATHHAAGPSPGSVYRFEAQSEITQGPGAVLCEYQVWARPVDAADLAAATPVHTMRLPDTDDRAGPLLLSISGDSQSGPVVFTQLLEELAERRPDLNVLLGDVVQNGWAADQWLTQLLGPLAVADDFGARVPSILVRGNHDVSGRSALQGFFGTGPGYSAFMLASAFVVVLDSNTDPSQLQSEWLEAQLGGAAAQQAAFRLVLVHMPPFVEYWDPVAWRNGESRWGWWVRDRWAPIFERLRVDLVLSGHQHNYQRGARNGTHYVILGGAGGDLDHDRVADHGIYSVTRLEHHAALLRLDRARLSWQAISPLGAVLDSFELSARPIL